MNQIENEILKSKQYEFTRNTKCQDIIELTPENVAMAEAMIRNDSNYSRSIDVNAKPQGKYQGSTAYWMTKLKDALLSNSEDLIQIIKETVKAVDRENSTHISADGVGVTVLSNRIFDFRKNLIDDLKNREKGMGIIKKLSERTFTEKKIVIDNKTYFPRENYSFATKFCHYACFYFYSSTQYQDNFSIYDSVVSKVLPLYLKHNNIYKSDGTSYKVSDFNTADKYFEYSQVIDKLRNNKISRNGFDHLLWYFHKAR